MNRRARPSPFDLLAVLGAAALFASLFMVWSHQLTRAEVARFPGAVLYGVPSDPTAFQVYASSAVVLALLAVGVAAAGLWGQRLVRVLALLAAALGLAFVIRAAVSAPTNGLLLVARDSSSAAYFRDPASSGVGETVAIVGLAAVLAGLLVTVVIPPRASAS